MVKVTLSFPPKKISGNSAGQLTRRPSFFVIFVVVVMVVVVLFWARFMF